MTTTEHLNGYGPLAGIKVVEMCTYVAGPATVRVLSDMGAEVIKIEAPVGDAQRTQGPAFGAKHTETEDPTFDLNNTNKNLICVNTKNPEGLEIAMKLISEADIFVTNTRTKSLKKFGMDYDTLHAKYPGLIWAQMRGYGEYGVEKDSPGYDAVCWAARGGVAGTFCERGTSPAIAPQAFGDYNCAIMLAAGILGALVNKLRTGKGDKVTVNLYHGALWAGGIGIVASQFGSPYPKSRKSVPSPFNNTYKTKDDKWIYICQPNHNKYYNEMMEIIGRPDMKDDPRFCRMEDIKPFTHHELVEILDDGFSKKTFAEWDPILREHQVPFQTVFDYTDIVADDEAYDNDGLRTVHYKAYGDRATTTIPIRYGSFGDPPMILSKPLGYHTAEYMHKLGYNDEQIKQMEDEGAIVCWHGEEIPDKIFKSRRQNAGEAECAWEKTE
ncbi:MAG: CaiB/BaiF CoA transferase family protein [Eggerthellaceae bacterium]|jgi:crotonobetainyl-CoA:carnitine CoA-transferase CaiB-like acyl-CoA transferase